MGVIERIRAIIGLISIKTKSYLFHGSYCCNRMGQKDKKTEDSESER